MSMRSFTFLGTGTSVGVPMIGCDCKVCTSDNPRNHRFRCAGLIKLPNGNILIDTPPELRLQLLRAKVGAIHSVLFTHYHADHLHGLDDLRPIQHLLGQPVPLYCAEDVEDRIRSAFSYAFETVKPGKSKTYVPKLSLVITQLKPKQAYLTHLCHDMDHDEVESRLPKGVNLAYDGLTFEF
ncbi:MBL fold metallo-hydrolase [bacterium]|nr:MBL fold metallo-hydrolase [bacterium]